MAVVFIKKSVAVAVPVDPAEYTILSALAELHTRKETLMLVHRETGEGYRVLSYDPVSGKVKLKGNHGQLLHPKVGARECAYYTPVWR
jgi:hypothetical protein